ncbi:hypothetical protein HZH68_009679 [Vespula germanica]|uniref:EGF-like domain-containing protein n=1 Tax=Vespula germanica TaxID=30212 RepID=A0A834N5E9_VESGE|nr:hypothetical protein HZH68_009679 [Vespula germanica]
MRIASMSLESFSLKPGGGTPDITTNVELESTTDDNVEVDPVPLTEQIMQHNISIVDIPDVDDVTPSPEPNWDAKEVIKDVAYFIRAHKFQDYDRRYYKSIEEVRSRLYEEFPNPTLRSVHWEVRKHCQASFVECLKYLERIIKLTGLRREDDTVTVMKEQKWNLANNTEQILNVQRDCVEAQRQDNLTMRPFQGPIGKLREHFFLLREFANSPSYSHYFPKGILQRFQWRTSVSYYMCWYTMMGVQELANFGESCDNFANCLDEYGPSNKDPRADDAKPFACALYSFCPDHCCPMKHIWHMRDCFQSKQNPCYAVNFPGHRECWLDREKNRDFFSLKTNQINVSCECPETGYEWSSRFGLCVDVNECTRGIHNCTYEDGESCINLPGHFDCICRYGYVYSLNKGHCVLSMTIKNALRVETIEPTVTKRSLLDRIVDVIENSKVSYYTRKSSQSTNMSLREWYANREILLTGVTSELGQNLLEKILRTFPDVKVNLIVRKRNNLTKDDRVKKIFGSPGYFKTDSFRQKPIARSFEGKF